jgi:hypothetical protein
MSTIKTRAAARKAGDTIFYNGKSCARGHFAGRYVSSGDCISCLAERAAEVYPPELRAVIRKRSEARDSGETIYYTGKPCAQGHFAARYVSTGNCTECNKQASTARAAAAREQRSHYVTLRVHELDVAAVRELIEALESARALGF